MFKMIKIELFDQFNCLMDKCPDNCCDEDWLISVDNPTYELYQEIGIRDLDAKVTKEEPHVIIKQNGKCPFITSDGLCLIHKELGEDFLGNTCKSYPRFVSIYEDACNDLYIENIGLSCPAASDWVVGLDRICKLDENVYYEQKKEVGRKARVLPAEKNMKTMISFLQKNESYKEGMKACYESLGQEYIPLEMEVINSNDLLLRNISICFLFENLMLESQKESPDYVHVLDRICMIIKDLDELLQKEIETESELTDQLISNCLYKIMRKKDH